MIHPLCDTCANYHGLDGDDNFDWRAGYCPDFGFACPTVKNEIDKEINGGDR